MTNENIEKATSILDIVKNYGLSVVISVVAFGYILYQNYEMSKERAKVLDSVVEVVQDNTRALDTHSTAVKTLAEKLDDQVRIQN